MYKLYPCSCIFILSIDKVCTLLITFSFSFFLPLLFFFLQIYLVCWTPPWSNRFRARPNCHWTSLSPRWTPPIRWDSHVSCSVFRRYATFDLASCRSSSFASSSATCPWRTCSGRCSCCTEEVKGHWRWITAFDLPCVASIAKCLSLLLYKFPLG